MPWQTITVIGVCAAERRAYASELAAATARRAVTIEAHDGAEITRAVDRGEALVLDLETDVDPAPILDIAGDRVVCVVDARHMFDDLRDLAPVYERALPGDPRGDIGARARSAVRALECAHLIILVEWRRSSTTELSMMMALASHLNPGARIRLSRGALADLRASGVDEPVGPWRDRAGWVLALIGVDLHGPRIFSALDDAALTDDELAAGPRAWEGYDDPLPVWPARVDER